LIDSQNLKQGLKQELGTIFNDKWVVDNKINPLLNHFFTIIDKNLGDVLSTNGFKDALDCIETSDDLDTLTINFDLFDTLMEFFKVIQDKKIQMTEFCDFIKAELFNDEGSLKIDHNVFSSFLNLVGKSNNKKIKENINIPESYMEKLRKCLILYDNRPEAHISGLFEMLLSFFKKKNLFATSEIFNIIKNNLRNINDVDRIKMFISLLNGIEFFKGKEFHFTRIQNVLNHNSQDLKKIKDVLEEFKQPAYGFYTFMIYLKNKFGPNDYEGAVEYLNNFEEDYIKDLKNKIQESKSVHQEIQKVLQSKTLEYYTYLTQNSDSSFISREFFDDLLVAGREMHKELDNIVKIYPSKIYIVGDLHGQFKDLKYIFETFGSPTNDQYKDQSYLFNGDFVDRGPNGIEVLTLLLMLRLTYPNNLYLNRGNHESDSQNDKNGFNYELLTNGLESIKGHLHEFYHSLPLGHIINDKYIVVHGGIPFADKTIDQLNNKTEVNRKHEMNKFVRNILWSDPMEDKGIKASTRDQGKIMKVFGPDVIKSFLEKNNLKNLIRSHEHLKPYCLSQEGQTYTIFSASYFFIANDDQIDRGQFKEGSVLLINNGIIQHPPTVFSVTRDKEPLFKDKVYLFKRTVQNKPHFLEKWLKQKKVAQKALKKVAKKVAAKKETCKQSAAKTEKLTEKAAALHVQAVKKLDKGNKKGAIVTEKKAEKIADKAVGIKTADKIAITAITTTSSTMVKPFLVFFVIFFLL